MDHKHDYETLYHPAVTREAGDLGIKAADLRRCRLCERMTAFILTKDGWVPLFEDRERDEQDILLA